MPHIPNHEKYLGEKQQISDMWCKSYIDKLDEKDKENLVMASGLNNVIYTILERKNIHDIVELIKVDI